MPGIEIRTNRFMGSTTHAPYVPAELRVDALPFKIGRATVDGQFQVTPKLLGTGDSTGVMRACVHAPERALCRCRQR